MRRRLQRIVGIGVLLLAAGCVSGAGLAADLPQPRPLPVLHPADGALNPALRPPDDILIPVLHPPDALTVAREPAARWEKKLNRALMTVAPGLGWAYLSFAVAF